MTVWNLVYWGFGCLSLSYLPQGSSPSPLRYFMDHGWFILCSSNYTMLKSYRFYAQSIQYTWAPVFSFLNNVLLGSSIDALMENSANSSILERFIVGLQMDSWKDNHSQCFILNCTNIDQIRWLVLLNGGDSCSICSGPYKMACISLSLGLNCTECFAWKRCSCHFLIIEWSFYLLVSMKTNLLISLVVVGLSLSFKDDIGDKSVFIFNALPEEEKKALIQKLEQQVN